MDAIISDHARIGGPCVWTLGVPFGVDAYPADLVAVSDFYYRVVDRCQGEVCPVVAVCPSLVSHGVSREPDGGDEVRWVAENR